MGESDHSQGCEKSYGEQIVYVEEVATWRNWKKRGCGLYTVLSRWGKAFQLKQVHGASEGAGSTGFSNGGGVTG